MKAYVLNFNSNLIKVQWKQSLEKKLYQTLETKDGLYLQFYSFI